MLMHRRSMLCNAMQCDAMPFCCAVPVPVPVPVHVFSRSLVACLAGVGCFSTTSTPSQGRQDIRRGA